MNVLGKIFGLIILVLIVLLIVNFRSVLSYFDNLQFGGNSASPTDIGSEYINQIQGMTPKIPHTDYGGGTTYTAYTNARGTTGSTGQGQRSRVSAEKVGSIVAISTENLLIPANMSGVLHLWLSNTPTISNETLYIDMGIVRSGGVQTYRTDLGTNPDLSLQEYRYIMIVNPKDYSIYTQATLNK